jgi:hypothetical protein
MASDPNLGLSLPQHVKYFGLAPIRIVINSSIGSLHDDSDIRPSSQDPSHDPCHTPSSQSWSVDKINVLQTDMATTKVRLDHLKESVNTKISNFQTNLESSLTRTISNLDSKMDSKFDKIDLKFDKIDFKFDKIDSKFEILEKDIVAELKAEMGKQVAVYSVKSLPVRCLLLGLAPPSLAPSPAWRPLAALHNYKARVPLRPRSTVRCRHSQRSHLFCHALSLPSRPPNPVSGPRLPQHPCSDWVLRLVHIAQPPSQLNP